MTCKKGQLVGWGIRCSGTGGDACRVYYLYSAKKTAKIYSPFPCAIDTLVLLRSVLFDPVFDPVLPNAVPLILPNGFIYAAIT